MLTQTQYKNLPYCFKRIVDIDRVMPEIMAPQILPLFSIGEILKERKYQRRMCEISCLPPANQRSGAM